MGLGRIVKKNENRLFMGRVFTLCENKTNKQYYVSFILYSLDGEKEMMN